MLRVLRTAWTVASLVAGLMTGCVLNAGIDALKPTAHAFVQGALQ